jgi:fructokinase
MPDDAWALHVGTLALALDPPAGSYETLIDREAGRRTIILDPNVRPQVFGDAIAYRHRFERLAAIAGVVKLSDDDASWLYPSLSPAEVLELVLGFGPNIVAVTLGSEGAIAGAGPIRARAPGIAVEVADTVGAGDSFGAALIAALLDEAVLGPSPRSTVDESQLTRAVSYAVAAASVTCTRTGADPPTRADVQAQLTAASEGALSR